MPAGKILKKWTWLLDNVTVRGVIIQFHSAAGAASDGFDLRLDGNYGHMITLGNHNLYQGGLHVEAYSHGFNEPEKINRLEPAPLPDKPEEPFQVFDPALGARRDLQIGDHIEITGRWIIENQHEDLCITRHRGWLDIGCVWTELHPFLWDQIALVKQPSPASEEVEMLSLAAPIYEETYRRGGVVPWAAGVKGRVFIADDGSNYHQSASAALHVKAPPLPAGFTPHASLVAYAEELILNGTGLDPAQIRSIQTVEDGITIQAAVTASAPPGEPFADINDPANNRSVFQARYRVRWLPRLFAVASAAATDPIDAIRLDPQPAGTSARFSIFLRNQGPDPLQIIGVSISGDPGGAFKLDPAAGISIPAMSTAALGGVFSPPLWLPGVFETYPPYTVNARILIKSADPARESIEIGIQGDALGAPFASKISVQPDTIHFGQVRIGGGVEQAFIIRNNSDSDVAIQQISIIAENPAQQFLFYTRQPSPGEIIRAGAAGRVLAYFKPTIAGAASARAKIPIISMSIAHPANAELIVAADGEGIAGP